MRQFLPVSAGNLAFLAVLPRRARQLRFEFHRSPDTTARCPKPGLSLFSTASRSLPPAPAEAGELMPARNSCRIVGLDAATAFVRCVMTVAWGAGLLCLPALAAEPAVQNSAQNTGQKQEYANRVGTVSPSTVADAGLVQEALERWEQAASVLMPASRIERERLRVEMQKCSGHALSVVCRFRGPVQIESLKKDFHWDLHEATSSQITLSARPEDAADRLFFEGVLLTLDRATMLPAEMQFTSGRAGTPVGWISLFDARSRRALVEMHYAGPELDSPAEFAPAAGARPLQVAEAPRVVRPRRRTASSDSRTESGTRNAAAAAPPLNELLASWEKADRKRGKLSVSFQRTTRDYVFQVLHRERGVFWFRQPQEGRLTLKPVARSPRRTASTEGDSGLPAGWREKSATEEEWIWTPVAVFNRPTPESGWRTAGRPTGDTREAELKLVSAHQPWTTRHFSPQAALPLVAGIRAEELLEEFQLTIVRVQGRRVWLSARPRRQQTAATVQEYQAVLDLDRLQTVALREVHIGGGAETVWRFGNWTIGDDAWPDAALTPAERETPAEQKPAASSRLPRE